MKTSLRLFLAFLLIGYGLYSRHSRPKTHVKAPTTHYHGYALNQAAIKRAKLFTVLVSAEGWGGTERGTGVLIDPTHVLTCAHVAINDSNETRVFFYPGYVNAKAKIVYADKSKDLAVMEIDIPMHGAPVPVFQESYWDGQPITIIGNILGSMKWFVSYGIISGETDRDLLTDGLVKGGNSGGPWINEKGEIVALTDWGLTRSNGEDEGISGGISAVTINKFLKAWKNPSIIDVLLGGVQ